MKQDDDEDPPYSGVRELLEYLGVVVIIILLVILIFSVVTD